MQYFGCGNSRPILTISDNRSARSVKSYFSSSSPCARVSTETNRMWSLERPILFTTLTLLWTGSGLSTYTIWSTRRTQTPTNYLALLPSRLQIPPPRFLLLVACIIVRTVLFVYTIHKVQCTIEGLDVGPFRLQSSVKRTTLRSGADTSLAVSPRRRCRVRNSRVAPSPIRFVISGIHRTTTRPLSKPALSHQSKLKSFNPSISPTGNRVGLFCPEDLGAHSAIHRRRVSGQCWLGESDTRRSSIQALPGWPDNHPSCQGKAKTC